MRPLRRERKSGTGCSAHSARLELKLPGYEELKKRSSRGGVMDHLRSLLPVWAVTGENTFAPSSQRPRM